MQRTCEAIYEDGIIRLVGDVRLAERTRVLEVVPEPDEHHVYHIYSPRLVRCPSEHLGRPCSGSSGRRSKAIC